MRNERRGPTPAPALAHNPQRWRGRLPCHELTSGNSLRPESLATFEQGPCKPRQSSACTARRNTRSHTTNGSSTIGCPCTDRGLAGGWQAGYRGGAGTGHASTRREALRGPSLTGLGPFPIHVVIAAAAIVVGWLVVRAWARWLPVVPDAHPHRVAVGLFFDSVLVGLPAARLGYVVPWWADYQSGPPSLTAHGDIGFLWWRGP